MKFTDSMIRGLKPKDNRYELWESRGFGIRVFPSGEKSWVYLYRFQGKNRRMTLGKYPNMSLVDAHAVHSKARQMLQKEVDPGIKHIEAKTADRMAITVAGLCGEYLEKHAKRNKKTWQEDERTITKDIIPVMGNCKARDIRRRDIKLLLEKIIERGAGVQANRTLALISKMFSFAVEQDILDASPCVAMKTPTREKPRDRVLAKDEIKGFWNGLDDARMDSRTKLALKLLLVTAQRKGEIVNAEWAELDLKSGWWTIPAKKAKNGLAHRVPLSSLAVNLLKQAKSISGESKFVFPSPRAGKPMTGGAVRRALARNLEKIDMVDFTPHDLRRTAASLMTGIGISRLVVSKILNHVETGITAVYDRHGYDNEKHQALDAWAREIESILTGKVAKVITLQR